MARVIDGIPGTQLQIQWTDSDVENPEKEVTTFNGTITLDSDVAEIHDVQSAVLQSCTGDVPVLWLTGSVLRIEWDPDGEFHYAALEN